ncbi:MAG: glycosyltransferase [Clostridiales bacterium]|jgi:glycosyltransferase involved in cell wall biosynthesis|nr:glycosyltransferase [Clostridiales bacterium]
MQDDTINIDIFSMSERQSRMKKILFILDYFVPHVAPTGQLIHELCVELSKEYKVDVLAMNAAENRVFTRLFDTEHFDGLTVYRIRTKKFDKTNKLSRIRHEVEFFIKACMVIIQLKHYEIGFVTSQPPILGGLLGVFLKLFRCGKFVYNIQDFNPEQTQAVGYVKSNCFLSLVRKVDSFSCNIADRLILVGRDMFETLENRGLRVKDKCSLINNWADDEEIKPLFDLKVQQFRKRIAGDVEKIIMYSGNLGLYYDLENLITVIGRFRHHKDVMFVFIGDGAKKRHIEEWVTKNQIENIKFIPYQDKKDIVYSLNAADVHLVTSRKGIKGVSVPSKIYGVMAAGKFPLGILEEGSEAAELIHAGKCGIVVSPGDYDGVYRTIDSIIQMKKEDIIEVGLRGRVYLEENLRKRDAIKKYKELFNSLSC